MKTRRTSAVWKFGMPVLLWLWCIPHLAGAGTVPPLPTGPLDANGQPATPDYYTTANWAYTPPLAKFVDTLPGLGSAKANSLGQYLSVAKPDITTYPGSDYYEIDLVEYRQRLHADLPAPGTLLRGYVQVNRGTNLTAGTLPSQNLCGTDRHACRPADTAAGTGGLNPDPVRYLGPNIVSEKDRPVRIKFTNRLPVGSSGDLFIPVDTSVMGAGTGPASASGTRGVGAPCDNTVEPNNCASYTQNRADIHLHGARTPWISDGTPHQWITPAGEITPFTKGPSFRNVPDMPDPGDGSMTYYYTNQQSARLMFYHDHAFGITRLGVYAGGAAGYLLTDQWEQDLITRGIIPPDQIPLIIQDKTFVDATMVPHPVSGVSTPKVRITDPLWNWGSAAPVNGVRPPVTGDLWLPHVYMPAQTLAAGFGGVNPYGRWMYGPWFYPATAVEKGPLANPYYDADCSSPYQEVYANCSTPGQPTLIPGTPHPSMGMEAFQDSAVVNGTVFPSLTVDPRAYRFRILNGASDRFWNLSFYQADPAQVSPDIRPASRLTEVKTVPASAELAQLNGWPADWPVDGRDGGVPDPALMGPSFLQIGTESGFLPYPDVREPQPVTYNADPTAFWVGTVDKTGLALGPAERADVIVDFSAYAGKTLILYNDAPAAWPARVPGYDYYTGAPDQRDTGGYGTGGSYNTITGVWELGEGPQVGYAPNTRTVMQVIVRPAGSAVDGAYSFNQAALEAEFTAAAPATGLNPIIPGSDPPRAKTLFERAQEPIIVGQQAYGTAYPDSYFPPNYPWQGINQINDHFVNFVTVAGDPVVVPTEPKGIHDEMGESFDPIYGRMSGNLAMQLPNPTNLTKLLVLYGFSDVPTETVDNSIQVNVTVVPDAATGFNKVSDGTQIWKISHNGVDTHPIHFHIFDVQLINRVGWDGQTLLPEPNELGWKEVVKISPLMDTIVAVRPRAPALPFGIPNSLRPLNPAIPIDSPMGFNSVDWTTGQVYVAPSPWAGGVTNQLFNFGWEYVWHCHILSHEEMDMMRPIVLNVVNNTPDAPVLAASLTAAQVNLSWTDSTPVNYVTRAGFGDTQSEIGFRIERATGMGDFAVIGTALANATTYTDATTVAGTGYRYHVVAFNAAGDSVSNTVITVPAPVISTTTLPGGIVGVPYSQTLTATGGLAPLTWSVSAGALPAPLTLNTDTGVISGTPNAVGTFTFTVMVTDAAALTDTQSLTIAVTTPPVTLVAPTDLSAVMIAANQVRLRWTDRSAGETNYRIQRATNAAGTNWTTVASGISPTGPLTSAGTGGVITASLTATLNAGTNYRYRVAPLSGATVGPNSNVATVNLSAAPAAPTSLTGSAVRITGNTSQDRVTLNWTDNANNESTFQIQRSFTSSFAGATTYTVGANVTTFSQSVSRLFNFYYRVRASNAAGNSGWSNVRYVTTP